MVEGVAETPLTPTDHGLFVFETGRRADHNGAKDTDSEPDSDDDDDDDAASASEDEAEDAEYPILTQIEDLKKLIKSGAKLEWKQIWKAYPLVDDKDKHHGVSERDGRTILHHLIVEYSNSLDDKVRTLLLSAVKKVTSHCPKMLSRLDDFHKTPLYEALTSSAPKVVRAIVEKLPADTRKTKGKTHPLTEALRVTCGSGKKENCLHAVMRLREKAVSISLGTFQKLCDAADEATISAPDSDGKTPLHYALDYQHCSEEQFDLILKLLDRCGSKRATSKTRPGHVHVLDRYILQGDTEMSLYQYHKQSRQSFSERDDSIRPKKAKSSKTVEKTSRRSEKKREEKAAYPTEEAKKGEAAQSAHARLTDRQKDDRAGTEQKNQSRQPNRLSTIAPGSSWRAEDYKAHGTKEEPSQHQQKSSKHSVHRSAEEPKVDDTQDGLPPLANMRLPRSNTGSVTAVPSQAKPKVPEETKQERINRRNLWSDRIQDVLKMKVMRSRSHNEVTKFLYGKNTRNVQIYFDYRGQSPNVDPETFRQSFDGIEFESVLKYVAFPSVEVEQWKSPLGSTDGRSDMIFFFDWLRSKNVKRILRVIVDDTHEDGRSHADEAIERCLIGMEVEELEWQKENLDPETICRIDGVLQEDEGMELLEAGDGIRLGEHRNDGDEDDWTAGPQVKPDGTKRSPAHGKTIGTMRQLHLWWSGDNAVLRGWSDPEGLRLLPQLKSIRLTSRKGTLESKERTERNIAMFKHRMSGKQLNRATQVSTPKQPLQGESNVASADDEPEIKPKGIDRQGHFAGPAPRHIEVLDMVAHHGGSKSNPYSHEQVSSSKPSNRWMLSTDKFAKRVNSVWDQLIKNHDGRERPRDIVVALIDDGVDLKHQDLQNRILPGRTFAADGEMLRPWYQSEKGHGTVMARAICHVCPMVKIYPIRLNTTGATIWHTAIDANSAIEAIEAAVDKKVDIISISWTVQVPTGEMKERFKKAIERATDAKILIFTSSADSGNFEDKYWPSGYSAEAFIRVGAAKPEGTPADMIGDLDKLDFILPGVDVSLGSSDDQTSLLVMERSETGSSIATALGAGLAAMLLYCTYIAVLTGKNKISKKHLEILHQRNDMRNAFLRIMRNRSMESDSKFVEVSQMFDNPPMDFRLSLPIEQATTLIADWVRDLIPQSQFGT